MKARIMAWVFKWQTAIVAVLTAVMTSLVTGGFAAGMFSSRLEAVEAVKAEMPEIQSRLSVVEKTQELTRIQVTEGFNRIHDELKELRSDVMVAVGHK